MTATLEKPLPSQGEVTPPKTGGTVTSPQAEEAATVAKVEEWLAKQNPNGPVARAKAMNAETAVPKSPELEAIGAERVGSHESPLDSLMESVGEATGAAASAVGSTVGESLGQKTDRIGLTPVEGWRRKLAQRIRGKIPFLRRK